MEEVEGQAVEQVRTTTLSLSQERLQSPVPSHASDCFDGVDADGRGGGTARTGGGEGTETQEKRQGE